MRKKLIVTVFSVVCFFFLLISPLYGQTEALDKGKANITKHMNKFSNSLLPVIPNVSLQQGVWPDAYIGKVFPGFPPHLGGGVTAGFATVKTTALKDAIKEMEDALSVKFPTLRETLLFPTITVDAKVGGLFLPFDIGLSIMKIPHLSLSKLGAPVTVDFLRWEVLSDMLFYKVMWYCPSYPSVLEVITVRVILMLVLPMVPTSIQILTQKYFSWKPSYLNSFCL